MQPTQELLSIPRRPLDVEDYIDIVRRHKSWIAGPAFAALVIAVVAAFMWPDTYVSEATVQVVPPQVPERFVASNLNTEMSQRINQMAQVVRSRDSLTAIIQANGLYRSELQRKPMSDVVEEMNKAIGISPVVNMQQNTGRSPISAFKVSFEYSNRFLAQKVTAELVSRFIDENIRAQATQSTATTEFLKEQLETARTALEGLETKLTAFRVKNAGRLPDELQANLTTLGTLQQQLSGVNDTINRIGQEKLLLESQIRIYKDELQGMTQGSSEQLSTAAKSERLSELERQILNMETGLASLRERYKDTHPDVQAAEAQLAMLRNTRDQLIKQEQEKKPQTVVHKKLDPDQVRGGRELEAQIQTIQSQIQAKNLELEQRQKVQAKIVGMIDQYNQRIQASPLMDKAYSELMRDYRLAKERYEDLNNKRAQSEIANRLENSGQGERLSRLDAASLPETPVKPKRLVIIGVGAGVGLLLGIFIAGGREVKDTSLKNLKDARAYTNLPVLGTVPLLENDLVVRRKRRLVWVAWSTACIVGVIAMTSSIYYYYAMKL